MSNSTSAPLKKIVAIKQKPKEPIFGHITDVDVDDTATNLTNIEDIYQDKDLREHIYTLPDTYIGSLDPETTNSWVLDELTGRMIQKEVSFIPGFYKTFDEILVNANDQHVRMEEKIRIRDLIKLGKATPTAEVPSGDMPFRPVKTIKVSVNKEEGRIVVENDGDGIDVEIHKKAGIYVPQMIFGQLLTSTNYQEDVKKIVGGKNGYGAKLTNIFSKEFVIETVDAYRKRRYKQVFRNNMTIIEPPEIEEKYTKAPFTRISYVPDLARFKMKNGLDEDTIQIMKKRTYDVAACTHKDVTVYWNDSKIDIKQFEKYVDLFIGPKSETKRHYATPDPRWEICACPSLDHNFMQVSYVNGICTSRGGKHVEYISNQICKLMADYINEKKKKEKVTVKPAHVKNNLWIFVKSTIENPSFDTQTKECLTSKVTEFGSKCVIDDDFIAKLAKTDIVEKSLALVQFKEKEQMKGSDGTKRNRINSVKLEDAKYAGTNKSLKCQLILTEGDSAKTFAMEGLQALTLEERHYFGVFPLRGKLLNVRDASLSQISKNEEICELKNIIGLKQNSIYKTDADMQHLRYGSILIICDQDVDGEHIKGLLINFFHAFWPSLLQRDTFIRTMITPLVKVWKMKKVGLRQIRDEQSIMNFYSENDYKEWKLQNNGGKGWEYNYYKGLGTSNDVDAKDCFRDNRVIKYNYDKVDVLMDQKTNLLISDGSGMSSITTSTTSINSEDKDLDADEDGENDNIEEDLTGTQNSVNTSNANISGSGPMSIPILGSKVNLTDYCINMAFRKGFEDSRKAWIRKYDPNSLYNFDISEETYSDFINKRLITFSYEDCIRSIPSICDGLKVSMRKIMYGAFKKKLKKDLKVAQFSGYIAEHTGYHHGENSLQSTIVGLAQDFVGSNNINLLEPSGQFGTRMGGSAVKEGIGKDSASARYIYTRMNDLTPYLFMDEDAHLYKYLREGKQVIEPEFYLPILPMVLVNGSVGIGTGFSTTIPGYNPMHLVENIELMMNGGNPLKMIPWYHGFKGEIYPKGKDAQQKAESKTFVCNGVYRAISANELEITELPINDICFSTYKKYIMSIEDGSINIDKKTGKEKKVKHSLTGKIIDVDFTIEPKSIRAVLKFAPGTLSTLMSNKEKFERDLKLVSNINCTNMYLHNHKGIITKYGCVEDILKEYYAVRLEYYVKRKDYMISDVETDIKKVSAKAQFIKDIHNKTVVINEQINGKVKPKKKIEIQEQLIKLNYPQLGPKIKVGEWKQTGEDEEQEQEGQDEEGQDQEGQEQEGQEGDASVKQTKASYDYLLSMRIDSLTEEMIEKLEKERDALIDKLARIKLTTPESMWKEDLHRFKDIYVQWLESWHQKYGIEKQDSSKLVKKIVNAKKIEQSAPKKVSIIQKKK